MVDTAERPAPPTAGRRSPGVVWGEFVARHRYAVLGVGLLVVVISALLYPTLQSRLVGVDFSVADRDSSISDTLVGEHFAAFGTEQLAVTFSSTDRVTSDPRFRERVEAVVSALRGEDGVVSVVDPYQTQGFAPQISADKTAAVALVGISGDPSRRIGIADRLQTSLSGASRDGVTVSMTGYSPITVDLTRVESADATRAESVGIPIALLVLVLALGGIVAGAIPLISTGIGLLFAFGVISALAQVMTFDILVTTVASMIGLGLGIDYSLFVVSRFREELARQGITSRRDTEGVVRATGVAVGTAGHTIAISGLIVMIALASLTIVDVPAIRTISLVVALTIVCVLLAAWTVLPAGLAALGPSVDKFGLPERFRPADARIDAGTSRWARWARHVMRHPWRYAVACVLLLVLCVVPLGSIKYGVDIGTSALRDQPSGPANTVLAEKFAPGTTSPITTVFTGPDRGPMSDQQAEKAIELEYALRKDPRVSFTYSQSNDGRSLMVVIPSVPIDSSKANDLVQSIRDRADAITTDGGPRAYVGGTTALVVDASSEISGKLPWVVAAVLGFSFLYLALVFRSIVIPVKAVLMNLLVTGAAMGLTVAVFQWGWLSSLLGFTSVGFVQIYLPITVFAVVFGLSMDYEVFLIGRMREVFARTGDNLESVVDGIEHTARPITAAAAIMIAVFASFLTANVLELKQFGFALSVAVLFDAVLVRMILVPAMMRLFGARNWWPGGRSVAPGPAAPASA
ncbi:MMPL family transporter [Williamsia deligens]|uniref:MMPL family transporter n=1 Tax=Williamsia deligens TaxID=321325 RepID=A0ABW3GD55_9NOCA|nr:efflux RND transporter permease subunit [Williamsia deligens]MCP2192571.1 putative drug exporter of the RND superfamily [Williamsia deligens]